MIAGVPIAGIILMFGGFIIGIEWIELGIHLKNDWFPYIAGGAWVLIGIAAAILSVWSHLKWRKA